MATKRGLRTIAVLEALKGALVLAVGVGFGGLAWGDGEQIAEDIVLHFHLNPTNHTPRVFMELAAGTSDTELWFYAGLAAFYATIRLAEAWGLWWQRRWAEWLGAVSAGIYIPFELNDLRHRVTPLMVGLLTLNVFLVVYLCRALWGKHKRPA
jgi:uncharacterized membrane protein (DUF2068 family)